MEVDPGAIDLRVGLEVHQQLVSTRKLFCECPVSKSEEFPYSFERRLRPSQSETGKLDPAAVFEFSKGVGVRYFWNPESSCLVEADEEPPHQVDGSALDAALTVALVLKSEIIDEIHVMRKIVIDGSNPGGFQRTAVVGLGGKLRAAGRTVGVQSVTLEEDAARLLAQDGPMRRYGLDRLGLPLVEIALEPVRGTPGEIGDTALALGRVLRSTELVARGLGTIRQDLNVSIFGGSVVEVKGVQKLSQVSKVVAYEVDRQLGLKSLADEIAKRGIQRVKTRTVIVPDSVTKLIPDKLSLRGEMVRGIVVENYSGLLGWEPKAGLRLGKELAEVARANSLGGITHSDEFESRGLSKEEATMLLGAVGAGENDALILVAGAVSAVDRTVRALEERLRATPKGAPPETRSSTDDGETRYMRPRPGAQRMYPETDIPIKEVPRAILRELSRNIPEDWEARISRYQKEYSLSRELALRVYDSEMHIEFEKLANSIDLEPSVVASTLLDLPVRLAREGVPESALTTEVLSKLLEEIAAGNIAKEAAPDALRVLGSGKAKDISEAVRSLKILPVDQVSLEKVVDRLVKRERPLILEKREGAFSPLMGELMRDLRGRVDGQVVSQVLKSKISEVLKERA